MATLREVIVDTDSAFPGFEYSSFNTAESNEQGDISSSDEYVVINCLATNGTADTTGTDINGWTTAPTCYVEMTSPTAFASGSYPTASYRHSGSWDESKYRYEITDRGVSAMAIQDQNVRLTGLQMRTPSISTDEDHVINVISIDSGSDIRIENCIIRGANDAANVNSGIYVGDADATMRIKNNIIYDIYSGLSNYPIVGGLTYAYNNTCIGGNFCIRGTTLTAINNICQDANTRAIYEQITGSGYNVVTEAETNSAYGTYYTASITTGASTNKLIDSGSGLSVIPIGAVIRNSTDTTYTYVTAVDSDTQLSVNDDIFTLGESYTIYTNKVGTVEFRDSASGNYLLDSKDDVAIFGGTNLYTSSVLPVTDDIVGNSRGTSSISASTPSYDIGAHHSLEYEKIIDTDSGAGYDYTAIATWESSEQGDTSITGSNKIYVATCRASSGTTDAGVVLDTWTTDRINYVKLWTDPSGSDRHSGIWDSSIYSITATSVACIRNLGISQLRIIGLQLYQNSSAARNPINDDENSDTTAVRIFSHNLIKGNNSITHAIRGIDLAGASGSVTKVYNNIIYDIGTAGSSYCVYSSKATNGLSYVYNNTCIGGDYGIYRNAGSTGFVNNLCQSNATSSLGWSGGVGANTGWNVVGEGTLVAASAGGTSTDLATGTADSDVTNKLVDSGGGLSVAKVGSVIVNTTDTTYTWTTAVDSDTQLSINDDIFASGTGSYRITSHIYGNVEFQNSESKNFFLGSEDDIAMFNGLNVYTSSANPVTDDILRNSRGSEDTNTYDIGAHHSLEYTKIVDTDSGSGYDYSELNTWESGEQADLTKSGSYKISVATCRTTGGSSDDNTSTTDIDGWTTEATNYIKIWTDPTESYRHSGVWDDTKYRRETGNIDTFNVYEKYILTDGLQIGNTPTANGIAIYEIDNTVISGSKHQVKNTIFKCNSDTDWWQWAFSVQSGGDPQVYMSNCLFFNGHNLGSSQNCIYIRNTGLQPWYIYNTTVIGGRGGINKAVGNGAVYCVNVLCADQQIGHSFDELNGTMSVNYCASNDANAENYGGIGNRQTQSFTFVNSGSDNFELDPTDDGALMYGLNLYTSSIIPITDDIKGRSRGSGDTNTYDIGAFHSLEYGTVVDPGSGSGYDYTGIREWEAGEQGDISITGSNKIRTAICRATNGNPDYVPSDELYIVGWTTDLTNYIKWWTDPTEGFRHNGIWNTGAYRFQSDYANNAGVDIEESNVRFDGIQMLRDVTSPSSNRGAILSRDPSAGGEFHLSNCIIVGGDTSAQNYINAWNSYTEGAGKTHYIYNNIFYDWVATGTGCGALGCWDSTTTYVIFNNTMVNVYNGIYIGDTGITVHAINNLMQHIGLLDIGGGEDLSSISGYNITNDGGLNTHIRTTTRTKGTSSSDSANKLIDSGGGLSVAKVGSIVENDTANTWTYVTAIDSDTQLSLNDNRFTSNPEIYNIYTATYGFVDFQNSASDNFLLDSKDDTAIFNGTNLYTSSILPISGDILGNSRGNAETDTYDAGAHHSLEYTKIVDPGSGSGYDYLTLASWESNEQTDISITGSNKIAVATCRATNGAGEITTFGINGWTTDTTNYIKIWTDPTESFRHSGVWDDTKYRIDESGSDNTVILVSEDYVRIDGLQLSLNDVTAQYSDGIDLDGDNDGEYYISNNIIRNINSFADCVGIGHTTVSTGYIWNNIVYGWSGHGIRVSCGAGNYSYVFNNTVIDAGANGITRITSGILIGNNNLIQNSSNQDIAGNWDTGSTHNVVSEVPIEDDTQCVIQKAGTTTGVDTNKLIDGGGGLSTIRKFSIVEDGSSNYSYVTAIDSDTQLSVNDNIFTSGEAYTIYENMSGIANFRNSGSGDYLLDSEDDVAIFNGTNLYTSSVLPVTDDIVGNSRGTGSTTTYDVGAHHSLEYTKIIDTDSGSGYDYTDINTWETNEQGDISITGSNKISVATCRCTGGSPNIETSGKTIEGWTTDATGYIKIWTDPTESFRHSGVWDDSKFRVISTNAGANALSIEESFTRFIGIQVTAQHSESNINIRCRNKGEQRVERCIVKHDQPGSGAQGIYMAIPSAEGAASHYASNNIVYDIGNRSGRGGMHGETGGTGKIYFYNNTIYNCYEGIDTSANDTQAINNVITGSTNIMEGTFFAGTTNNVSESILFVNAASDNFLLDSKDDVAIFGGINLYTSSTYPITDDIRSNSRGTGSTSTYDAGAHHSLEYTKIVDPGSGSGYDYTSLANWSANEQADISITGSNKIAVATCRTSDGTADTTGFTLTDWTTDATNHIKIWTDPTESYRHSGVWDDTKYRLVDSETTVLLSRESYVRLEGLQFHMDTASDDAQDTLDINSIRHPDDVRISHCIVRNDGDNTSYNCRGIINGTGGAESLYIWNTLIYDVRAGGNSQCITNNNDDGETFVYNVTAIGGNNGIRGGSATPTTTTRNCYAGGAATSDFSNIDTMVSCASEDTTGSPGLQNVAIHTINFANVTAGAEDFNLPRKSALIFAGVNPSESSTPLNFTDDIKRNSRGSASAYDVGAFHAPAFAKVVDTDGGTGSDYGSLSAWESNEQADLTVTGSNKVAIVECYATNGTADTTTTDIIGWTTSLANYIEIMTLSGSSTRHQGIWNDNIYRLVTNTDAIDVEAGHFRVTGLQIHVSSSQAGRHPIDMSNDLAFSDGYYVYSYNLIRGNNSGVYDQKGIDIWGSEAGQVERIYNNIFYDISKVATSYGLYCNSSGVHYIYNNTVFGGTLGISRNAGSGRFKNNICQNQTSQGINWSGGVATETGWNIINDSTLIDESLGGTDTDLATGTADGDTTNKLIDSGGGLSAAVVGSIIANTTDSTYTWATAIDSDTQLSINDDIFASGTGSYRVTSHIYGNPEFQNSESRNYLLNYLDEVAILNGTNLYTASVGSPLAVTDDILSSSRGSGDTDNFDIGAHHSLEYGHVVDTDSGPGSDYSSLSNWDTGEQADLTISGSNKIAVATCRASSGSADDEALIDGWTTSAKNHIRIWTDPTESYRHLGYWNDSVYRIIDSDTNALRVYERYVNIHGLQIELTSTNGSNQKCIWLQPQDSNEHRHDVSHNIIKGYAANTQDFHGGIHHYHSSNNPNGIVRIWNNIVYDVGGSGNNSSAIQSYEGNTTYYWYNNTIFNSDQGLYAFTGSTVAKNNLIQDTSPGYAGTFASTSTHNVWDNTPASLGTFGIKWAEGTTDGTETSKLLDSTADFSNVQVSSLVKNVTDTTYTRVTAVAATTLSLSNDYFTSGEIYEVYTNMRGDATFVDEANDNFLLDYKDTIAMFKGKNIYTGSELAIRDDILGNSRGTGSTPAFDVGAHNPLEYGNVVDPGDGVGADYTNLSDWESNEQADLRVTALNKSSVAICRSTDGTNDTTAFTIDGWTPSLDNYIKIWTDISESYRHPGYWVGGNYYRFVVSDQKAITVVEPIVRFEGLMINVDSVDGVDDNCITLLPSATVVADIRISKNLFRGAGITGGSNYHCGVSSWDFELGSSGSIKIWNNMFYNFGDPNSNVRNGGINMYNDGTSETYVNVYAYNNTFQSCSYGAWLEGNTSPNKLILKNNIAKSCYVGFDGLGGGVLGTGSTHNVSDAIPGGDPDEQAFGAIYGTGNATTYGANKLQSSFGGLDVAKIGSVVANETDGTAAWVTAIDSATTLSLSDDIFDTGNEQYAIHTNKYGSVTFQDEGLDNFLLKSTDTMARDSGSDLSSDPYFSFEDDILGRTRPINIVWDIGANEFQAAVYKITAAIIGL
jgi:hypothetical protein